MSLGPKARGLNIKAPLLTYWFSYSILSTDWFSPAPSRSRTSSLLLSSSHPTGSLLLPPALFYWFSPAPSCLLTVFLPIFPAHIWRSCSLLLYNMFSLASSCSPTGALLLPSSHMLILSSSLLLTNRFSPAPLLLTYWFSAASSS